MSLLHRIESVYHRTFPIVPNTMYHSTDPIAPNKIYQCTVLIAPATMNHLTDPIATYTKSVSSCPPYFTRYNLSIYGPYCTR